MKQHLVLSSTPQAAPVVTRRPRWIQQLFRPGRLFFGSLITLIVVLTALFGPLLLSFPPEAQDITQRLKPASTTHWLGTDNFGRDLLSRVVAGGRVSLAIGFLSMVIAVAVGVLIGTAAGFFGGAVDAVLMRLTELVLIFPTFFLLILAVATFGRSVPLLILVISFTSWPSGARIMRGEVLKIKERDFILAARSVGASSLRIMLQHILPNVIAVIIISATIRVGSNILIEAGLSYLGLGVQPPLASWGNMISDGASVFRTAWWVAGAPSAAVFLTVFGFNLLGEGLRDLFTPYERQR